MRKSRTGIYLKAAKMHKLRQQYKRFAGRRLIARRVRKGKGW